jgi:hypothetical protein
LVNLDQTVRFLRKMETVIAEGDGGQSPTYKAYDSLLEFSGFNLNGLDAIAPLHLHLEGVSHPGLFDLELELVCRSNVCAIHFENDIAPAKTGLSGRGAFQHSDDEDTVYLRQVEARVNVFIITSGQSQG